MEEARYWNRRKLMSATSHVLAYSDSWEEQAFAEDSAGPLGGFIWPPRSYSCSFCGREFRSAQALGGHMNVHRRERARLKESTNQSQKPSPPTLRQYPSQVCTLAYNPNPKFVDAGLPPSGVLLPSTQDNCREQGLALPSFIIDEQPKLSSQSLGSSNSNIERDNLRVGAVGCWITKEFANPNFALSPSDSIIHGSRLSFDSGGEEEEATSRKRQKKGSTSTLLGKRTGNFTLFPFFMSSRLGERHVHPSGVLEAGSNEELDLELRLGDAPKVK